jgi:hypothetical protein
MAKQAETARQLRTALSVLLPQTCGVTNATTGQVLGVGVATVVRMQKEIRDLQGAEHKKAPGVAADAGI